MDQYVESETGVTLENAEDALRETFLNLEGIEEEIAVVKRRLNEWIRRISASE
jgi:hypothetical protein